MSKSGTHIVTESPRSSLDRLKPFFVEVRGEKYVLLPASARTYVSVRGQQQEAWVDITLVGHRKDEDWMATSIVLVARTGPEALRELEKLVDETLDK